MPGRATRAAAGAGAPAPASGPRFAAWSDLLPPGRAAVMGVVNVTPDSFSDGGLYLAPEDAVAHALRLAADGADILDIGGESTRPGADPVEPAEEIARVVAVIAGIRRAGCTVPISIDTTKAAVAEAACAAGADAVNDVSALNLDPRALAAVAALGVPVVLMHMQGEPRTMQLDPTYGNVVGEVADHLAARVRAAVAAGIPRERIAVDPGIGFGKTVRHNLLLLRHLDHLVRLGLPVVVGTSRKAFIGHVLGGATVDARDWGTAATVAWAVSRGAAVVRVHSVREMREVARMTEAIARP
jgi:dihydropteroate synthase